MKARALFYVLMGDGINCERETALAIENAGGQAQLIHINQLVLNPSLMQKAQALALPGGFSFGDELGSGQVLALKMKHKLKDQIQNFVENKKPIIGICNGFQVLTKLGLLPEPFLGERQMSLAPNQSGKFINQWVKLKIASNAKGPWMKGLQGKTIELPIRHGEGRVVFRADKEDKIYEQMNNSGQIALSYEEDVNGSFKNIAGVCDPSGMILGMMPHPEACLYEALFPHKSKDPFQKAFGQQFFDNIMEYLN